MTVPGRWRQAGLLALVVAASTSADLFFFTGFIASDDILYTTGARHILETGRLWSDPQPHEMRLFMLGWCALGIVLGLDVQGLAASFVVFHQFLAVLTFFLGRLAGGNVAGGLACFWVAVFPAAVSFSTIILPDLSMACFLCLAFLLAGQATAGLRVGRARRAAALAAASGLGIGIAYLHKESGLVPLPFLAAWCLWTGARAGRGRMPALAAVAAQGAGLLAVLVGEAFVLRLLTGAWTFRLRWVLGSGGELPDLAGIAARLTAFEQALAAQIVPAAAIAPLAAALLVCLLLHRPARPIVLHTAWFMAYYVAGSVTLGGYSPPSLQARYFIPCVPFVAAALAGLVARALEAMAGSGTGAVPVRRVLARAALAAFGLAPLLWWDAVDRSAGRLYAAPMFRNARRGVEAWTRAAPAPLVLSEALSCHLFPSLVDRRPVGLRLSHEVDAAAVQALRASGTFYFLDVDRRTVFVDPAVNPLLVWPHGVPPSDKRLEKALEAAAPGRRNEWAREWAVEPVAVFRSFARRTAEVRVAVLGGERPGDRLDDEDQAVTLFRVRPRPLEVAEVVDPT